MTDGSGLGTGRRGKIRNKLRRSAVALVLLLGTAVDSSGAESTCRGTTSNGALENGCKLPISGENFTSYSYLGVFLGRTYVHCTVSEIVLAAYAGLGRGVPDVRFVYGETGFARGGPFKPHRTHQNGLSVDFFVPIRNAEGRSVALPTHALNKWGYAVEFDGSGRFEDSTIDFEALAAHILALHHEARRRGAGIRRVIFDPELQPRLHSTRAWPELGGEVEFSDRPAWVRHDEHYDVDFDLECRPLRSDGGP